MPEIYPELIKLADSDMYPFHMPGHKRNLQSTPLKGAFRCDITEIDDFDNLHDANGLIKEAQLRANRIYGSDETFFLINGSTSGVLSAVSAAVPKGGKVLAARGSHKSFYHALYLREIEVSYLPVKIIKKYGIFDGYLADDIERELDGMTEFPSAVFITSPTYEGKCSDVRGIAEVCHEKGVALIVDAAHGAHFGLGNEVPENAVSCGADLVIHSVHKTLPSMTQTALLHVQGNLIDRDLLRRFLRIYQSSSPSYVLMASIDLCMKEMEQNGKEYIENLVRFRKKLQDGTERCRNIRTAGLNELEDPGKVLICLHCGAMTGQQLYDILREEYRLQLEMAGDRFVLAILSGWDSESGIDRLIFAINDIDKRLESASEADNKTQEAYQSYFDSGNNLPERTTQIWIAWEEAKEVVPLSEADGRISGEFLALYPPGVPLIVPGEKFDRKLINTINKYLDQGMNMNGIITTENRRIIDTEERGVLCVKQR